jgi:hypothetical protein
MQHAASMTLILLPPGRMTGKAEVAPEMTMSDISRSRSDVLIPALCDEAAHRDRLVGPPLASLPRRISTADREFLIEAVYRLERSVNV